VISVCHAGIAYGYRVERARECGFTPQTCRLYGMVTNY
jgi:hypothetical protein